MDSDLQGREETAWIEWIISDNSNTKLDLVDFFISPSPFCEQHAKAAVSDATVISEQKSCRHHDCKGFFAYISVSIFIHLWI